MTSVPKHNPIPLAKTPVSRRPWYTEPWPWLLMAGPLAVIIAGGVTLWLAIRSDDGLVADDYYKQGLAINKTFQQDQLAATHHYRAEATITAEGNRIQLWLSGDGALPKRLRLRFLHPTMAGRDQVLALYAVDSGRYEGGMKPLPPGRWNVTLEDTDVSWRLSSRWDPSSTDPLRLQAAAPAH